MTKDTIQLFIGNESSDGRMTDVQDYSSNIKSYSIRYDLFQGAGSFNADLDVRISLKLSEKPLKFLWKINDKAMLTGYIDKKELSYSKGSFTQSVSGRDMMQVLIDNFVLSQDPYENKKLDFIINDVYNKSRSVSSIKNLSGTNNVSSKTVIPAISIPSITFTYTTEAKALASKVNNFKHIKTRHGQTLFDFISDICNQVGLYLFNIPGTNEILIHRIEPPESVLNSYNREGLIITEAPYQFFNTREPSGRNNIISCSFAEDITDYHKYIKLVGMAQQDDSIAADYYKQIYGQSQSPLKIEKIEGVGDIKAPTITLADRSNSFAGVTKFKVSNVNECDANAWVESRDLIINNLLLQQNRKLYTIRYTVANHSPEGSTDPYFINHTAQAYDDFIGVQGQGLLTYAVEYKGSKEQGLTTDITLCVPSVIVPRFAS